MIRKIRNKKLWKVESEKTHKNMGIYKSKQKAKERLKQIEYFKYKKGRKK